MLVIWVYWLFGLVCGFYCGLLMICCMLCLFSWFSVALLLVLMFCFCGLRLAVFGCFIDCGFSVWLLIVLLHLFCCFKVMWLVELFSVVVCLVIVICGFGCYLLIALDLGILVWGWVFCLLLYLYCFGCCFCFDLFGFVVYYW